MAKGSIFYPTIAGPKQTLKNASVALLHFHLQTAIFLIAALGYKDSIYICKS